jgi:hypothetical protein
MELNHSDEPFGTFDAQSMLDLLKTFCEQFILFPAYESLKEKIDKSIDTSKNSILDAENHLVKLLKIERDEFTKNKSKYLKQAKSSDSYVQIKTLGKIERVEEKIKNLRDQKKNLNKLDPVGVDFEGNIYWHFSFLNGIVIEMRTENENISQYFFDIFDQKILPNHS